MTMTRDVKMADVPGGVRDVVRRRNAMHDQVDRKVTRSISTLLSPLDLFPSFRRTDYPASNGEAEPGSAGVETFCAQ